jgi:hypothetical protein
MTQTVRVHRDTIDSLKTRLQTAERERKLWETVASNRLHYLLSLDRSLRAIEQRAFEFGVVYGRNPLEPASVPNLDEAASGEELYRLSRSRCVGLSAWMHQICTDSVEIDASLSEVMELAQQAAEVGSPTCDLELAPDISHLSGEEAEEESGRVEEIPEDQGSVARASPAALSNRDRALLALQRFEGVISED